MSTKVALELNTESFRVRLNTLSEHTLMHLIAQGHEYSDGHSRPLPSWAVAPLSLIPFEVEVWRAMVCRPMSYSDVAVVAVT
ncbi:hypothetical protein TNCV_4691371 [Trichonephila clavipes]|nr:hypothetical protein TNCV_4691371 [Trichonephila clavipes]